jgi:hypothetical protein
MPSPTRKPARQTSGASKEPAALKRLNKSLDSAQDALKALRKDVGKDVGTGARDLYQDLERFVKGARRDSTKLGKALQRDVEQLQKRLAGKPTSRRTSRPATRRTSSGSTTKKARVRGSRAS